MKIEKEKKEICKFILKNICYMIVIFLVLYNLLYSIHTAISKKDYFSLGGVSIFNMDNDLMNDEINKNDLVIVKKVPEEELKKGDIIAYNINGNTRINKIFNYTKGYITKSNKNYQPDIEVIEYDEVIGKKVYIIKNIGLILVILQSKITSLLILMFLLIYFIYNKKIYNKKKERARKKKKFLKQQ